MMQGGIQQTGAEGAPPAAARRLDPAATFDALVDWVRAMAAERGCPGLAVGLSGTDSILAFMACARAMERLGRPEAALGVHYAKAWPPAGKTPEQVRRMLQLSPSMEWMQLSVMPWLAAQFPESRLVVDSTIDASSDHQRWSALMSRALAGADPRQPLETAGTYWVVGTHNATERALMTYSNISCAVSVQPLVDLWKGEVLAICQWLGVPEVAIARSRQADCDCGRFDTAAAHIAEVDAILMCRAGHMPRSWLQAGIEPALLETLEAFVEEQIRYAGFKASIPYSPADGQVVRCL